MMLAGKVAIITGAGSGIGQATARRFADEGARLVLNDINDGYLQELTQSLAAEHRVVVGDVAQEKTRRPHARRSAASTFSSTTSATSSSARSRRPRSRIGTG